MTSVLFALINVLVQTPLHFLLLLLAICVDVVLHISTQSGADDFYSELNHEIFSDTTATGCRHDYIYVDMYTDLDMSI